MIRPLLLAILLVSILCPAAIVAQTPVPDLAAPPVAPVRPVADDYHGTQVVDPYRYMENLADAEVQAWMRAQAAYTRAVLDALPGRAELFGQMHEMWNSTPEIAHSLQIIGGKYYTLRLPAGARQEKLYVRDGVDGTDRLLIDPELLPGGEDGLLAIDHYSPSPDHRYIAYVLASSGSEEGVIHILDTHSERDLPETADRFRFIMSWLPDSRSFFYGRSQALSPDMPRTDKYRDSRMYLHEVGRSFEDDPAVLGRGVNDDGIDLTAEEIPALLVSPSSPYATAIAFSGVDPRMRIFVAPIEAVASGAAVWRTIAASAEEEVVDYSLHGETLYLISLKDAPKGRIFAIDLTRPGSEPRLVVPESDRPLSSLNAGRDALYWTASAAGIRSVYRLPYEPDASPEVVQLPYPADVTSIRLDPSGSDIILGVSSWVRSYTYLSYDASAGTASDRGLQPSGRHDLADDLTVEEVDVTGWDGTRVPLSIVHRKGLTRDGSNITLLAGYGAYGQSMSPSYLPIDRALYDLGMVLATCHVRGGGELGEEWHLAGFQETKPNTWKDFIACAEYLVEHGYTRPDLLSGRGGSAGGILVNRAIQERPDLFGAAVAIVPATDMLRFETTATGVPNIPEFGSVQTEAGFRALYAMSPYANVVDGTEYPALLITTGINDRRVDAWMAAKFAARMQAATTSDRPVLLSIDYESGHDDASIDHALSSLADQFAFVLWQAGHPDFQPGASAPDAAPQTGLSRRESAVPHYASPEQLRSAAQAGIDDIHDLAASAGLDLGPAPRALVQTAPPFMYYLGDSNQVVLPWWEDLPAEVQTVFAEMSGGSREEGERLFRATTHGFGFLHETGHWLRHRSGTWPESRYESEDDANRIAVAFLRTQPGGEDFLTEFERMIEGVLSRLPDPTPEGDDPGAFFDANYWELGYDPVRYSYYQYRFILDALRERERLDFGAMLAAIAEAP